MPLDRGASERAFSTYVPGRVAPMLPPELSENRCSLRPNEDRLCVTVEMPPNGEPKFYRSIIRSRARLTYAEAERRDAEPEVVAALEVTDRLTAEMRDRRFARGALRIETPEINFEFDGKGGVARAWKETEPTAHRLIEELMIAANEAVAELLSGRKRPALYRVHERPDPQAIELLLKKLADLGVPTPPAPKQLSPATAAAGRGEVSVRVMDYVERSGRGREAFPSLVLRSLKQARYHPENLGHSGLASPAYCHFTSPIRRYPDLVVHRALLRELGLSDDPPPGRPRGPRGAHLGARARGGPGRASRRRPLPGLAPGGDALRARLGRPVRGRDRRDDRLGPVHPVRRRLRGLPAREAPGRATTSSSTSSARPWPAGVGERTYRLGDPIKVLVEKIEKAEGKVELSQAGRPRR